jgi:hypothetical protein
MHLDGAGSLGSVWQFTDNVPRKRKNKDGVFLAGPDHSFVRLRWDRGREEALRLVVGRPQLRDGASGETRGFREVHNLV